MATLRDTMAEMESGERLECDGFRALVEGTRLTADELMKKVLHADLYMSAAEALALGLVAGIV